MKGFATKLVLAGSMIAISSAARADFSCQVNPAGYIGFDGASVLMEIEGRPVKICSFTGSLGDLGADACKVWISNIMTARAERKVVQFTFHEYQVGGATSCSQITAWSVAPPFYMEVR